MKQPRLGHINFINCLPLNYGLVYGGFDEGMNVHSAVPSSLNRLVLEGELDASPVSSIVYARNSDRLVLLPDVSISANGALESIMLVSKHPINELKQSRIALTAKSATSHCLLKIILHHSYQAQPEYYITSLSIDGGVLEEADAVLFIGDDALYAYHNQQPELFYYDLGAEWKKLTGMRMVYAVWVVNRQFADRQPEAVQMIYERVTSGFNFGLSHLADAVDSMNGKVPFSSNQLSHYIGLLNYQFSPEHEQALVKFYTLANELGLIQSVPTINFAEVQA
ncbi:MAG: menaquinone biosynthesis protein [Veillonellales bacterium]